MEQAELEQTKDDLLNELWANHQDLGDILTMLASMLNCGKTSGTEESNRRCFDRLLGCIRQYTDEIQQISDILVQKAD